MTISYNVLDDQTIERVNEDGSKSYIPTDPTNSDYQRYLAWLENPDAEPFTPPA